MIVLIHEDCQGLLIRAVSERGYPIYPKIMIAPRDFDLLFCAKCKRICRISDASVVQVDDENIDGIIRFYDNGVLKVEPHFKVKGDEKR